MDKFYNRDGKMILDKMVRAIHENKDYLGEVDGLIGDGDHGMNMNKGFTLFQQRYQHQNYSFTEGLEYLGGILFNEIGGSMGPIYGTLLSSMTETVNTAGSGTEDVGGTVMEDISGDVYKRQEQGNGGKTKRNRQQKSVGKQTGLYSGNDRGGHRTGKSMEIPISHGKKRGILVFGGIPVFYMRAGTPGYDHGDVIGKKDQA